MGGKRHFCPFCGSETRLAQRQKTQSEYCSSDCLDMAKVHDGSMTEEEYDRRHPHQRSSLWD